MIATQKFLSGRMFNNPVIQKDDWCTYGTQHECVLIFQSCYITNICILRLLLPKTLHEGLLFLRGWVGEGRVNDTKRVDGAIDGELAIHTS